MQFTQGSITNIIFPESHWGKLVSACQRKLDGDYLPGETQDKKAFGLVAGTVIDGILTITAVAPLLKNVRSLKGQRQYMDDMMTKHAVPSETPLDQRGWVADPDELQGVLEEFRKNNYQLIGSYHIHRVPWEHDQERDTPTKLDTVLGKDSRMFMFIISMVNPKTPVIRAFFEGDINLEVPISWPKRVS